MNQIKENKDKSREIPKFSSFKPHLREAQNILHKKYEKRVLLDELRQKESFTEDENSGISSYEIRHKKTRIVEKIKPFVSDLSGDINNVIYGKNDRYSIPYYRRSGGGRVIGCEEHIRLRVCSENPNEIVLSPFLNYDKYQKQTILVSNQNIGLEKEVEESSPPNEIKEQENYIPFDIISDTTVIKNSETDLNNVDSNSTQMINDSKNALNIWKDGDPQLEIKELSKKIEASPLDYKLWLELVDKQDKALKMSQDKNSKAEQLSIGDVKLKILEKALSYSPDNEELLLKYVSIITLIWEPKKVEAKWEEILKKTLSLSLWKKYLNFFQTNSISFSYTECIERFQNSLQTLKEASKNEKCFLKKEEIILYILVRLWFYMKEAGYTENSIASIQALIEFNFFRPDIFSYDTYYTDYLQEFEQFWEAEAPRFGEYEAKGWKNYYNDPQNITPPKKGSNLLFSNDENISENIEDKYVLWCKQEIYRGLSTNPKRSTDTSDNDPYSVVLFSDIEQLLYFFTSNKIRSNLIYFSLHFLGFSLYRLNKTSNNPLLLDSFVHDFSLISSFDWFWLNNYKSSEFFNENIINSNYIQKRSENPLQFKLKNWPITIDTLFSIDKTCVRKLAKSILRKNPSNMKLWCAYAQLEYLNGNIQETRKIFLNILENVKPNHTEKFHDCVIAYKLWAEIEMKNNEINNSIKILVSMVENGINIKTILSNNEKTCSNSLLLKAQKSFQHLNRLTLSFKNYKMLRLYTECYALLIYLVKSLDSALNVYRQTKNDFSECIDFDSIEYEQLLISELKLLYNYSQTTKTFKISIIQDRVKNALSKFPNNCIFLSIFSWAETKSLLKTKIYHYFEKNIFKAKEPSFIVFLSAIWTELYINPYKINIHPIRNLFERAVENQATKSDLIIWKLYIQFEIQYGTLDKGKAIFYRAIRDCPWSKNLMFFAFNDLRSRFNSEELTKLYNTMIEREFRIFVDLEITENNQKMSHLPLIQLPQDISSDEIIE
ncbi:hypothetical protein PMAC_001785 [Pneumocystis sp. 'macacae']|nr:hypothetical protein PMAC_001785 [Pneumocystis sp. 'macacae']